MHPHKRVHTLHVLGTSCGVFSVKIGVSRAIDSLPAIDDLAEVGGELFVRRVPTSPESVPSHGWDSVIVEMSDPCRLAFVDQVGMPAGSTPWIAEVCFGFCCLKLRPNDTHARNTGDLGCLRLKTVSLEALEVERARTHMHFDFPIPFTQRLLLLRRDILVPEENNTSFSDKEA